MKKGKDGDSSLCAERRSEPGTVQARRQYRFGEYHS